MGNEGDQHLDLSNFYTIKVHSLMCLELRNIIDRVSRISSSIESARPRCSTGLKALCSMHNAMDRAKQIVLHCSESSKLYLALTADKLLLRCEGIRNSLSLCLGEIQNMVPTMLAAKISGIVEDLRGSKFVLEPFEEEAGKVIKTLLKREIPPSDTVNEEEYEALELVAVRLKITSPLAVLNEKRSIKKLHDRTLNTDPKRKALRYLLYLVRKYAELIQQLHTKDDDLADKYNSFDNAQTDNNNSARIDPPVEFKCPISMRIMFDPVILASGKTYERVWIQKWFKDGNDVCPVTQARLENLHLTPNVAMKSIISKWASDNGVTISEPSVQSSSDPVLLEKFLSFGSIKSVGSSLDDLNLQVSNVSFRSSDTNPELHSFNNDGNPNSSIKNGASCRKSQLSVTGSSFNLAWISKLDTLSWDSQCKAVRDIKEQLQKVDKAGDFVLDGNYMKPLIQFLKNARDVGDVNAQNDSADVLLSILNSNRTEMPPFEENAIYVLTSYFDSEIIEKALAILESLSCQPNYKSGIVTAGIVPSIVKVLEGHAKEFNEQAMKILLNLSCNEEVAYHIVYLDYVPKLVPFVGDDNLAGYCLRLMNTLCDIEEGRQALAGTNWCIASIAAVIETGTEIEQEAAMQVLLALSYEHKEQCLDIMQESVIRALRNLSVDGNPSGKAVATELVQILEQKTEQTDASGSSCTRSSGLSTDSSSGSCNHPKKKKSRLRRIGNLGRRISRFFLKKD